MFPTPDTRVKVREYNPAAASVDFEVSISANDGKGGEATAMFTIRVTDVNRPPVLNIPDQTIDEGETLTLNLLDYTTDPDTLDTFTYTLISGVGNIEGSTYTYTATYIDAGTKTVTVRVTDNKGGTSDSTFKITVNDVNRPPTLSKVSGPQETTAASSSKFTWSGSDPDGTIAKYEYRKDGGSWTDNGTNTSHTWSDYSEGDHTFEVRAQDNEETYSESISWEFIYEPIRHDIVATANPPDGGFVLGNGNYIHGTRVTLEAISNEGYEFVNWTESGIEVSVVREYEFLATKDREFIANFSAYHSPEFDKLVPANGAINQPIDVKLEWNAIDADGDSVNYDVYFGYSSDNLSKVLEGTALNEYSPEVIKGFTFYWKVVASDGSTTKDSGVMTFSTIGEVLTDKSVHIIDNFLSKQPSDPVAIVVQVKGIGTISGSEIEIEIDTDYMEFVDVNGLTLVEFLAANAGATHYDFEPWCEYKSIQTDIMKIAKLKSADGSKATFTSVCTSPTGTPIADGELWFVYVKTKTQAGKTDLILSDVAFMDTALNKFPVDSTDQGLFIVK